MDCFFGNEYKIEPINSFSHKIQFPRERMRSRPNLRTGANPRTTRDNPPPRLGSSSCEWLVPACYKLQVGYTAAPRLRRTFPASSVIISVRIPISTSRHPLPARVFRSRGSAR